MTVSSFDNLTREQAKALFDTLTSTEVSDDLIKEYLLSTSNRIVGYEELAGAATSLREKMYSPWQELPSSLLDTCGTGGSGLNTFNTSTAVSFITAAAGVPTSKHGNRGRTSKSGSADVLEALGLKLDLAAEQTEGQLKNFNWCFLFAPLFHPATKRVQQIRKDIGVRTIFNFLGPLLNPMSASSQVIGVSSEEMLPVIANALAELGTHKALVVRGDDGLDEISVTTFTKVFEVTGGKVVEMRFEPEDFGLPRQSIEEVAGSEPQRSAERIKAILRGESDPCRNLVLLNAGAALYVANAAPTILAGTALASETIKSGKCTQLLKDLCG